MKARIIKDFKEYSYRVYVTDAAKVITSNTARLGGGNEITKRWYDAINASAVKDDRTADEIALDIMKNAGLRFKGENG